ncbi:MAG: hypothetical protein ACREUU_12425, partial [Gammaproteobacteria bacterium]
MKLREGIDRRIPALAQYTAGALPLLPPNYYLWKFTQAAQLVLTAKNAKNAERTAFHPSRFAFFAFFCGYSFGCGFAALGSFVVKEFFRGITRGFGQRADSCV